jgi:hypothetical protein
VQAFQCKDGRFRLGPLKPGRYALEAHGQTASAAGEAPLTNSAIVHVEAGATDVELRLRTGCNLVLSAVDRESGAPVPVTFWCRRIGDERSTSTGGKSTAVLHSQSPGPHRVVAWAEDGRVGVATVEVAATGNTELTVEVAPGGRVRVKHGGTTGVLSASLDDGNGPFGVVGAHPGEEAELVAPVGAYSLHLLVRQFNTATQTMTTLRDEVRKVLLTAEGVLDVEGGT